MDSPPSVFVSLVDAGRSETRIRVGVSSAPARIGVSVYPDPVFVRYKGGVISKVHPLADVHVLDCPSSNNKVTITFADGKSRVWKLSSLDDKIWVCWTLLCAARAFHSPFKITADNCEWLERSVSTLCDRYWKTVPKDFPAISRFISVAESHGVFLTRGMTDSKNSSDVGHVLSPPVPIEPRLKQLSETDSIELEKALLHFNLHGDVDRYFELHEQLAHRLLEIERYNNSCVYAIDREAVPIMESVRHVQSFSRSAQEWAALTDAELKHMRFGIQQIESRNRELDVIHTNYASIARVLEARILQSEERV